MKRAIFKPMGTTNPDILAGGGEVEVLRQLGPDEADYEVGPMFKVRNIASGHITDAFADELTMREGE